MCHRLLLSLLFTGFLSLGVGSIYAHCDALDGPVVVDARKALEIGDVGRVLRWVPRLQEGEVRRAFQEALRVRRLGDEARELAERYFFETLVRLHRAGEGAPYTGLKPAGQDLGAAIPAADRALAGGSLEELDRLLLLPLRRGLAARLHVARDRRTHADESSEQGRQFVAAYVDFVHYVKGVHEAVEGHTDHHQSPSHEAHGEEPR